MKIIGIKSTLLLVGMALATTHTSLKADVLFQDEFNGSINPAWNILREDEAFFTVNPTELDLRASSGILTGGANNANNVFLIANPTAGDFVMTLRLNSFVPAPSNYAQIDLLAYDDDDNLVRSIYVHLNGTSLEIGREISGGWSSQYVSHNFGSDSFYLRLSKVGNVYTQSYSTDGTNYTTVNSSVTYGNGTPAYLGFVASDDPTQSSHAYIDSLTVTGSVPEPSVAALIAGSGALACMTRRRSR